MPDEDRELLLAHNALICLKCRNLRSECSDVTRDWHPRTEVCWASASTEWAWRRLHKKHEKDKGEDGLRYLDGRWVWVGEQAPPEDQDEFG